MKKMKLNYFSSLINGFTYRRVTCSSGGWYSVKIRSMYTCGHTNISWLVLPHSRELEEELAQYPDGQVTYGLGLCLRCRHERFKPSLKAMEEG